MPGRLFKDEASLTWAGADLGLRRGAIPGAGLHVPGHKGGPGATAVIGGARRGARDQPGDIPRSDRRHRHRSEPPPFREGPSRGWRMKGWELNPRLGSRKRCIRQGKTSTAGSRYAITAIRWSLAGATLIQLQGSDALILWGLAPEVRRAPGVDPGDGHSRTALLPAHSMSAFKRRRPRLGAVGVLATPFSAPSPTGAAGAGRGSHTRNGTYADRRRRGVGAHMPFTRSCPRTRSHWAGPW